MTTRLMSGQKQYKLETDQCGVAKLDGQWEAHDIACRESVGEHAAKLNQKET